MCRLILLALALVLQWAMSARALLLPSPIYSPTWLGPSPEWYSPEMLLHGQHLLRSFHDKTGLVLDQASQNLLDKDGDEAARRLFLSHERVVVSHGTQKQLENGPVLNYGNTAALRRWGASWEQLTSMPSRYTAEPMERCARDAFMKRVTEDGVVTDYEGVRIALDGTKFTISNAVVWNVVIDGEYIGQAATFLI